MVKYGTLPFLTSPVILPSLYTLGLFTSTLQQQSCVTDRVVPFLDVCSLPRDNEEVKMNVHNLHKFCKTSLWLFRIFLVGLTYWESCFS